MDGSGFQQWHEDKWSEAGWLDDHRWVEVGSRSNGDDRNPNPVTIQDLAIQSSKVLKGHSSAGQRIEWQMRKINGGDIYDGLGLEEPIEIDLGDAKVIAERQQALQEISGSNVHVQDVTIFKAHHSQRTFYAVQFVEASLTHTGHRGTCIEVLYISGAKGSGAREVGFVSSNQSRAAADYWNSNTLTTVKWLPDDRHISFIYNNRLYVVRGW
jgi:hypothetical protein